MSIMKLMAKNILRIVSMLAVFAVISSCSLDVTDPNSATEEEVLSSREGVTSFIIGMQGYYIETALPTFIRTSAVTTRELAINTTFSNLIDLEDGGTALPESNGNVGSVWSTAYRVIDMTDKLIGAAPNVLLTDEEETEITALARIYKAMALGYVIQNFEQAAINTDPSGNAEFSSRDQVLAESINLLQTARQSISGTSISGEYALAGFDIPNTINAMLARYNLMAGNYQAAIDAANNVDPEVASVFNYDGTTSENPLYSAVYIDEDYLPRDDFGMPLTEDGDQRLDFYLIEADLSSQPNELGSDSLAGFWDARDKDIPVYVPGEMNLIRAEAYVQLSQPALAVDEINAVRTKTAAEDPFGIGAELPPYTGGVDNQSLFTEIYYQRSVEMYLQGMRFEDARRLGRPVPSDDPPLTAERNRVYYPYPTQERLNNPNTPANPAI